jgi:hypothetical protein
VRNLGPGWRSAAEPCRLLPTRQALTLVSLCRLLGGSPQGTGLSQHPLNVGIAATGGNRPLSQLVQGPPALPWPIVAAAAVKLDPPAAVKQPRVRTSAVRGDARHPRAGGEWGKGWGSRAVSMA